MVIGQDTRISGDMLAAAVTAGILSAGVDVLNAGVLPTPGIAFLTRKKRALAGIMISASHNPFYDNGIKVFNAKGLKLEDRDEAEIEGLILGGETTGATTLDADPGIVVVESQAAEDYIEFLLSTVADGVNLHGLKIVLDCANGASSGVAPSFDWDEVGLYTARLTVNDGELDSIPDYVAVRSTPHTPNFGPTADAGGDIVHESTAIYYSGCSTCSGPQIILDASTSTDPDFDPLSYTWTIMSDSVGGAAISGEHAEEAELQMVNLTPGGVGQTLYQIVNVQLDVEDCQGPAFGDSTNILVTFSCECVSY